MSERYTLNASFVPLTPVAREDVLAGVLGALHPAVLVEDSHAAWFPGDVLVVEVSVRLAGEGEARDSVARIRNAPGLPPCDAVRYVRVPG